jgi:hypothetical protein
MLACKLDSLLRSHAPRKQPFAHAHRQISAIAAGGAPTSHYNARVRRSSLQLSCI